MYKVIEDVFNLTQPIQNSNKDDSASGLADLVERRVLRNALEAYCYEVQNYIDDGYAWKVYDYQGDDEEREADQGEGGEDEQEEYGEQAESEQDEENEEEYDDEDDDEDQEDDENCFDEDEEEVKDAINWIYKEGKNAPLAEYQEKMDEFKPKGDKLKARFNYYSHLEGYYAQYDMLSSTIKEKLGVIDHLTDEQKETLDKKQTSTNKFIAQVKKASKKLHKDPAHTLDQIMEAIESLQKESENIFNLPPPKVEEIKQEAAITEKQSEGSPGADAKKSELLQSPKVDEMNPEPAITEKQTEGAPGANAEQSEPPQSSKVEDKKLEPANAEIKAEVEPRADTKTQKMPEGEPEADAQMKEQQPKEEGL